MSKLIKTAITGSVMEYIDSQTLAEVIDVNPEGLEYEQVAEVIRQTAAGLTFLHDRGLVHRDLKPANLFWDQEHLKIADVGLSKFISASRRVLIHKVWGLSTTWLQKLPVVATVRGSINMHWASSPMNC